MWFLRQNQDFEAAFLFATDALIHNTDDHLRNHGFFLGERGITLSPAFDLNPSIERDELSLAINEVDSACDVSIALKAHASYGVSKTEAKCCAGPIGPTIQSGRAA
jgi:serine/threonine-protein kinase HipA